MRKEQPFIINPDMRLRSDNFVLVWLKVPPAILAEEAETITTAEKLIYHRQCQCFCNRVEAEFTVYYTEETEWGEARVQSWLRKSIRDAVIARGEEVLPDELHRIEPRVGLYSKSVAIKKLRKAYGNCEYRRRHINLDVMLVLLPPPIREEVMIHELCHLVVHSHSRKFWSLLTEKLGRDSEMSKLTTDLFYSRYHQQLKWLLK